jgi:hypothetical protein
MTPEAGVRRGALPLAVLPIAVVLGFLGGVLGRILSDAAVVPCDEMR